MVLEYLEPDNSSPEKIKVIIDNTTRQVILDNQLLCNKDPHGFIVLSETQTKSLIKLLTLYDF